MSTRSVIARQEGDTWQGRYVHNDGYPSAKVPELLALVPALGGYEKAVQFLIKDHFSWSSLGESTEDCNAHDDAEEDWWILADGNDCGTEWAYVLSPTGLTVLQRTHEDGSPATGLWGFDAAQNGAWLIVDRIRWSAQPSEDRITAMECGTNYERCKHYAWKHYPEAEGTRYGTAQWLGREEVRFSDANQIEFATGTRRMLTGSGGTSTADRPMDWAELRHNPKRPRYWWASVRPPEDVDLRRTYDERIARITKAGYKLEHALVFPPTAVRGELVVPAGVILRN